MPRPLPHTNIAPAIFVRFILAEIEFLHISHRLQKKSCERGTDDTGDARVSILKHIIQFLFERKTRIQRISGTSFLLNAELTINYSRRLIEYLPRTKITVPTISKGRKSSFGSTGELIRITVKLTVNTQKAC